MTYPSKFTYTIKVFFLNIASRRPFSITFITDNDEQEGTSPADAASQTAANNERELSPGGIVGFSLDFRQGACS